jgi:hypothetical protein
MRYIKPIQEATLGDDKRGINYALSRDGKTEVKEDDVEVTTKLQLHYTSELPTLEEKVINIRAASLKIVTFADVLKKYEVTDPKSDLFIYKTTSLKFPFAVAKKGINTVMIKQLDRKGSSARGDYFRETVFVIIFTIKLWENYGIAIECFNHDGRIPIEFRQDASGYRKASVDKSKNDIKQKFEKFEEDNLEIVESIIRQCKSITDVYKDSLQSLSAIYKNSSKYSINTFFVESLKEEREKMKQGVSSYKSLPDKINIAKWNPSDCWLVFKGYDWVCRDLTPASVERRFKKLGVTSLQELNDFLGESIKNQTGVVGISLKQQTKKQSGFFPVNTDTASKFVHMYNKYKASPNTTGTKIYYDYALLGQLIEDGSEEKVEPEIKGAGEIDVRTFQQGTDKSISLEVKGSKSAEHMSGKAGALIKFELNKNFTIQIAGKDVVINPYTILTYIRKSKDLENLKEYMDENYEFIKDELKTIFYKDLSKEKDSAINSRLQAIFFTDFIERLPEDDRNHIVSSIIRFAKSESDWSAPHTIVK